VLFFRNLLATVLIPGMVVGLVPLWIVWSGPQGAAVRWSATAVVGLFLIGGGAAVLLWSVVRFGVEGQGTLAPIDPPTKLVQEGLYRYTRNPMYLGALVILIGEVVVFRSRALLWYAAIWFVAVNLFVVFYEEPTLRRRFGERYKAYCARTRRWWVC
jgi:protein-S-isoprenylcysteine O-methyltransferase Ste14